MRARTRFVFEELNVDKVYREQQTEGLDSEFDELYNSTKLKIDVEREQKEAAEESTASSDDDTSDQPNEGQEGDDGEVPEDESSDDSEEADATQALESFLCLHELARSEMIATEDIFTKDNLINAAKATGNALGEGFTYLKDIGFEYGPVVLKHVYKGILYALDKTLKAIYKGTTAIAKYVKKRTQSYTAFKEKIAKARETVNLIDDDKEVDDAFTSNEALIQHLIIGDSTDFVKNTTVASAFMKEYFENFSHQVSNHVTGIERLIDNVVRNNGNHAMQYEPEVPDFKNFTRGSIQGYHPDDENIESYVYRHLLPGNTYFIGYLPNRNAQGRDNMLKALGSSRMFLGVNVAAVRNTKSVKLAGKKELLKYLDLLEGICNTGITLEKDYVEVINHRKKVKSYLSRYMRFLFNLQDRLSIHNSMVDFISMEFYYIDKTYVGGSLLVQDYMVGLLTSSLEYVKESIQALS